MVDRSGAAWSVERQARREVVIAPVLVGVVTALLVGVVALVGGEWGGSLSTSVALVFGLFFVGLAVTVAWGISRAERRADAAEPLPDGVVVRLAPERSLGICAPAFSVLLVVFVLGTLFFRDSPLDVTTFAVLLGIALGQCVGVSLGTSVAVRRYERYRKRTLYATETGENALYFWRQAAES